MWKQKIGISLRQEYPMPMEDAVKLIADAGFDAVSPIYNKAEMLDPTLKAAEDCGLYLQSLSQPMDFGTVTGDEELRKKYHALAEEKGNEAVHAILMQKDPASAEKLHPNDLRRVIRAIEVFDLTGVPMSAQKMPGPEDTPYDFQLYALDMPREILYARVDQRVDQMMKDGLLKEVEMLLDMGVNESDQSMQGLGYKELIPVLTHKVSLSEAVSLIKLRTRHFAKRQLTWFKRDERIQWLPAFSGKSVQQMAREICDTYHQDKE